MIIKENTTFNYQLLKQEMKSKNLQTDTGNQLIKSSYKLDYLEINMQSWRAKSITEDIINFISDYFSAEISNGGQEELRSAYAQAKTALDNSFNALKESSNKDYNLLKSAHQQAVKELKDWYHNGGEPREKVDLTTINIQELNLEKEISLRIEENTIKYRNRESGSSKTLD